MTIVEGGPQAANAILLASGKLDFYMGSSLLEAFDAAKQNIALVVVAADFQKDPQMFMSHPGVGLDKLEDLTKAPAFVAKSHPFFEWLVSAYGFSEDNIKPYTFNPQPFIADKKSIQQGYITSEPYSVEKEGTSSRTSSCSPTTAIPPTRPPSRPAPTSSPRIPISCSASSTPRRSAGTTISMATTKPPMS